MKLHPVQKLKDIAGLIGAEFTGDPSHLISGLNEIHRVEKGDIVFVDHPKYYDKALESEATTILINKNIDCPAGKAMLISEDPFRDFNKLVLHFKPRQLSLKPVSDTAVIGKGTVIMPGAYIGNNVRIGENSIIHPNVTIYDDCIIGSRVIIHSGSVIGSDAFYYKRRPESFERLISCGSVRIEDDVEIGACCTLNKGVTAETVIGKGSRLDDHVHIGHDTVVGEMCLFAAQVGIAGCVTIGNKVTLWGQAGVPSNITIADGTVVYAQSGLAKSTEKNKIYFGSPAVESREKMKELALLKQLPEIIKKLGL